MEHGHAAGIETTTGPLGQGFGNAVGMAMAEANLSARFGSELVDHRTWVIAGDGCLMEGISHEALALAGRLKLNKLIVIWDDNSISMSLADSAGRAGNRDDPRTLGGVGLGAVLAAVQPRDGLDQLGGLDWQGQKLARPGADRL